MQISSPVSLLCSKFDSTPAPLTGLILDSQRFQNYTFKCQESNSGPCWALRLDFHIELTALVEHRPSLCVDRNSSWFVSPAGSHAGPRLVKHSWVHVRIKAKVSFDGTSHFSLQLSALWGLEGKWIVARVAHPAWVETTALSFITRASAGSAELSTGWWVNYTEITPFCLCFSQCRKNIN